MPDEKSDEKSSEKLDVKTIVRPINARMEHPLGTLLLDSYWKYEGLDTHGRHVWVAEVTVPVISGDWSFEIDNRADLETKMMPWLNWRMDGAPSLLARLMTEKKWIPRPGSEQTANELLRSQTLIQASYIAPPSLAPGELSIRTDLTDGEDTSPI